MKKKKVTEEELKQKTYNLEQQRNKEIEHMNKVIELMQIQVDKKAELEKIQTEIKDKETKLQTKNIDDETKKQTKNDLLELKEKEKNLKASLVQDELNPKKFYTDYCGDFKRLRRCHACRVQVNRRFYLCLCGRCLCGNQTKN